MGWLEITNDLNARGKRLPVGKVLIFDFEGSPNYLKITRKENGKVWAKRLDPELFLTPQEADERVTIVPKN